MNFILTITALTITLVRLNSLTVTTIFAKANFEKVAQLSSDSNEAKMNLGLVKLVNKDYEGAREAFGSSCWC